MINVVCVIISCSGVNSMKCSFKMLVKCFSIVALISLLLLFTAVFRMSRLQNKNQAKSQYSVLSNYEMKIIQNDIQGRKNLLKKTCTKYSNSKILHSPGERYLNRMR